MAHLELEWQHSVKISPKIKKWLMLAAEVAAADLPKSVKTGLLSINLCGDTRMRTINREHRHKDKTTDVLSFPAQQDLRHARSFDFVAPGVLPLGDLVISLPQAQRQAREFKVTLEEELVHLFFHGFLHLCGYDHEISVEEETIMEREEARLLEKFAKRRLRLPASRRHTGHPDHKSPAEAGPKNLA